MRSLRLQSNNKKSSDEDKMDFPTLMESLLTLCPMEILKIAKMRRKWAEQDKEKFVPEIGDKVTDPSGNECIVINTDTHIHVVYPNGKTHKWNKDTNFTLVNKGQGEVVIAAPMEKDEPNPLSHLFKESEEFFEDLFGDMEI